MGLISSTTHAQQFEWGDLPVLPGGLGFGGPFAGTHNGALIVAGGANFPNGMPWDGGTKVWYDDIHVLESGDVAWNSESSLPHPMAYGISISTPQGLIVAGGNDTDAVYADVWLLKWDADAKKVVVDTLPSLPKASVFHAGALLRQTVYVAAGRKSNNATDLNHAFWAMDVAGPVETWKWESKTPWPGDARIKAVAAAQTDGSGESFFFFFSGEIPTTNPEGEITLNYVTDGYRYDPASDTWSAMADLDEPVAAARAIEVGQSHIIVFSGSTGKHVMKPTQEIPEFPQHVRTYNTITDTWTIAAKMPRSVVTTEVTRWNNQIIITTGEIRPGVRTPRVQTLEIKGTDATFGFVNYGVVGLYLAVLVAMGIFFAKREKGIDDFFLAGKRVPWWAAGLSIYATQLSAITFVSVPALSYATNWVVFPGSICILLMVPIVVKYYLPFFRKLNITTAYEYLEKRFNLPVRLFGSASFLAFQLLRMAVVIYLPALGLTAITGLNVYLCILLMGILSTVYTVLGGIEAVIWTDVLQVFVLLGGLLVSLILVLVYEGGPSEVIASASEHGKFAMLNLNWSLTELATWSMLLGTMMLQFAPYTTDQAVVQRYMTTKDEAAAAKGLWLNGLMAVPGLFLFYLVGTCMYVYFGNHPDQLIVGMTNDQVFPLFIVNRLPIGIAGLVIAGIFAASMSSLDSSMHSVATVVTTDFYGRLKAEVSDLQRLRVARAVIVIAGTLAIAFSFALVRFDISSLFFLFQKMLGLISSGLVGIFILGIFTTRSHATGVLIGAFASIAVLVYLTWFSNVNFYLHSVAGIFTSVAVGYGCSFILPNPKQDVAGLTMHS
jgi:SSS family transporter